MQSAREVFTGFDPFGGPPPIFTFFFYLIPIIVVGGILFIIVKGVSQWNHNNAQPILSVKAVVKTKRTRVSGGHETSSSTHYYVTFEVESGDDHMEFHVPGQEYGVLAEGDTGKLTFQGARYHKFEREYLGRDH